MLQEIGDHCNLLEIVRSSAATATFTSGDPSVLRQTVLMHAIPPPGTVDIVHLAQAVESVDNVHVCGVLKEDGGVCNKGSTTAKALRTHQCNSDSHPFLRRATAFVLTNQCPWCSTVLASQQTAPQYVRNAFQNDKCRADSDHLATSLKPFDMYQCPECSESFSCVFGYNRHIVQHLPPPTYIEIPDGPRARSSTGTRAGEEEAGGRGDIERAQQARSHSSASWS